MVIELISLYPIFPASWHLDLSRHFKDLEKGMANQWDYSRWVSVELSLPSLNYYLSLANAA